MSDSPLNNLSIASPCSAEWAQMEGTDQVRFCQQCQLNVYNLSAMAQAEAEALIQTTEGQLCVRFYKRADGTLITQDCPVGLQRLHRHQTKRLRHVAAVITLVTVLGAFTVNTALAHEAMQGNMVMGDVALPQKNQPGVTPSLQQGGVNPSNPQATRHQKARFSFPKFHKPCTKKPPKSPAVPYQGTPQVMQPETEHPVMGKIAAPINKTPKEIPH